MRFELFQEATEADDAALNDLDQLLCRVEIGVHELIFNDPVAIEQSRWFRSLRPHSQQLIRLLIQAQAWLGLNKPARLFIRSVRDVGLARDAAMTPLKILVENGDSDGSLVIAAVLAHGDEATSRTWENGSLATPRGWIIESAGGSGDIPRKIRERSAKPGHRLIVMCDSDRELPNAPRTEKIKDCEAAARETGLHPPIVVLPLREAENYLPDQFWEAWLREDPARTSFRSTIDALKSLKPDQRDHIDMEGDARLLADGAPHKKTHGPLFDGSDINNPMPEPHHLKALSGKRRNLKGSGSYRNGESRMPIRRLADLVRAKTVTAADLDQRDRAAMLRALVKHIAEEL